MFCYVESKNILEYPKDIPLMFPVCFKDPLTSGVGQQLRETYPELLDVYLKETQDTENIHKGYFIYKSDRDIIFINNRVDKVHLPSLQVVSNSLQNFLNDHSQTYPKIASMAFHEYRLSIDFHEWMEHLRHILFNLEGPYFLISVPYSFQPSKPLIFSVDGVSFFKGNYPFSLDFEWSYTLNTEQYQTLREYLNQFDLTTLTDEEIIDKIRSVWRARYESEKMGSYYQSCLTQIQSSNWFICAEPDPIFGIGVNGFDSKRILYKPESWLGKDLLGRAYTLERKHLGLEVIEPSWIQKEM